MKSVMRCDTYWAEPEHISTKARGYRAFAACSNRRKESFSNSDWSPLEASEVICSATLNHTSWSSLRAAATLQANPLSYLWSTADERGRSSFLCARPNAT